MEVYLLLVLLVCKTSSEDNYNKTSLSFLDLYLFAVIPYKIKSTLLTNDKSEWNQLCRLQTLKFNLNIILPRKKLTFIYKSALPCCSWHWAIYITYAIYFFNRKWMSVLLIGSEILNAAAEPCKSTSSSTGLRFRFTDSEYFASSISYYGKKIQWTYRTGSWSWSTLEERQWSSLGVSTKPVRFSFFCSTTGVIGDPGQDGNNISL